MCGIERETLIFRSDNYWENYNLSVLRPEDFELKMLAADT